jgi:hypothetical protein
VQGADVIALVGAALVMLSPFAPWAVVHDDYGRGVSFDGIDLPHSDAPWALLIGIIALCVATAALVGKGGRVAHYSPAVLSMIAAFAGFYSVKEMGTIAARSGVDGGAGLGLYLLGIGGVLLAWAGLSPRRR